MENIPKISPKQFECRDKFNQLLKEGDYVDVQKDGVHKIYLKEDNQLYFKPYGKEDKVCSYFSNDMVKCDIDGNWLTDDIYEKISEPKKETVEEAATKLLYKKYPHHPSKDSEYWKDMFIEGVKWQEEQDLITHENIKDKKIFDKLRDAYQTQLQRMYSEKEVLMILNNYDREFKINTFAYTEPCSFTIEEWFSKIKK